MRTLDFESLRTFIRERYARKALITFHSVGDRDGVASAVALSHCFENAAVATPDFITNNAKRMLAEASYTQKVSQEFISDADIVIATDANRLEVLGRFGSAIKAFKGDLLFIDHHSMPGKSLIRENAYIFNNEGYNSASSIVYEVIKTLNIGISRSTAILLLNGIVADSANFQNATSLTFKQISELISLSGLTYADISEYFHEVSSAERRQRLMHDLFSSKSEIAGKYLLVYGEAGAHANMAAESALGLGADASLFWVIKEDEVSMSARLRQSLDRRTGIHLGRIMEDAAKYINGTGGGHPCAAGAYGPLKENAAAAYGYILKALRKKLSA